jgi:REP element-mobilizing transposase RayT
MKRKNTYRLKTHEYLGNGYYFITIVTKCRVNYFGKIKNNKMILNKRGRIAKQDWKEIPLHFDNVYLDEFMIMPNHLHGILIIKNHLNLIFNKKIRQRSNDYFSKISPYSGSISTIIRSFKSVVSKMIHEFDQNFKWQYSFNDEIIRNKYMLENIRNYIRANPLNFEKNDKF